MKLTIRNNVWETNSSSVHSITICTKQEFEKWQKGELYYDSYEGEITNEKINYWGEHNYSYSDFCHSYYDNFEQFQRNYTSPSGDEIIVFGYYGYDG